ncbi:uncharacterized protein EV154DRAFT_480846 [Mucor mucedo]|uniref:uncharacterized protein n=1 Tax=Mucor mucedo TaxID=29922 RepID=UPI0022201BE5|nr:uncharacterized protein EV154DRAFT_480846 [Mucor mucedo]KAI7891868.1 hypothetical protein EV154DRAFT_480846 [Mucor mucedo]
MSQHNAEVFTRKPNGAIIPNTKLRKRFKWLKIDLHFVTPKESNKPILSHNSLKDHAIIFFWGHFYFNTCFAKFLVMSNIMNMSITHLKALFKVYARKRNDTIIVPKELLKNYVVHNN